MNELYYIKQIRNLLGMGNNPMVSASVAIVVIVNDLIAELRNKQ